ncbi:MULTISPECIES: hypothetical protein [unclassified Actinotalea]|uniref:hypothetical protein n=1 Tax=unclassified Actinotalea TaxID=2638618 RepID=UPI0015F3A276|nr:MULTISPECIES: hypothetical protein [unclassified Actinotalea]
MPADRDLVLQLAAQRAGLTEGQLDALRRRDWAALLAERTGRDGAAGAVADVSGPDDPPGDEDVGAVLERVAGRLAVVRGQRDAAVQLLRQLAARLGCCQRCWGTDPTCSTCAGAGSPGHFRPDPQLAAWIAPALARLDPAPPPQDQAAAPAAGTDEWV